MWFYWSRNLAGMFLLLVASYRDHNICFSVGPRPNAGLGGGGGGFLEKYFSNRSRYFATTFNTCRELTRKDLYSDVVALTCVQNKCGSRIIASQKTGILEMENFYFCLDLGVLSRQGSEFEIYVLSRYPLHIFNVKLFTILVEK